MKTKKTFAFRQGSFPLFVDVIMILLVIVNLIFVIFDWSFGFEFFRNIVQSLSDNLFVVYRDDIHPNFLRYDSFFILIFVAEFLTQWFVSIIKKSYSRWWIYPFVKWYDVLGCIPMGVFIWLRLFRVFAMTLRLHKMGVINLKNTFLYKEFNRYYQFFVQDASDRALIKLIDAAQRGVKEENKESIIADAINPDLSELSKILSLKVHKVAENNMLREKENIKEEIKSVIKDGFENSHEMKALNHIPLLGKRITTRLEDLLNDVSFQLWNSLSNKLASDEITAIVENIIFTSLDSLIKEKVKKTDEQVTERELNDVLGDIIDRVFQKLKDDIEVNRKNRFDILPPEEDNPN